MLNLVFDIISLQQLEYEMERDDIPDYYNCFEIGYCGHHSFPYAHIQLEQYNKLLTLNFQEEHHSCIYDTFNCKKTQLVCLYIIYRPKKNASRTDLTNNDQKSYAFVPTY